MPIQHRFDPETIAAPLAASLARLRPEPVHVTDVALSHSSGMSNETVFLTAAWDDGERKPLVARVPAPAGQGLFHASDVVAEHALMTALAREGSVPVPAPLLLEQDTSLLGVPFFVMPRAAGRSPTDDPPYTAAGWLAQSSPEHRAAVNDAALGALAALHAIDSSGFADALPRGRDTFAARLAHDEAWYRWGFGDGEHAVIDAAFDWLRAHQPAREPAHVLTWGDARISNIVFGEDATVRALVDWELAALGPRERDLGWWLFAYRHHTAGIGVPEPEGFPTAGELVARYEQLSGHRCEDLDYYEVLGGLEAALIMVRVARQMIDAGILPPDSPMALVNPATILLSRLIGMPELTGDATSFIGNRG
jgi:aminoglycoside phosphotransferase (APT) family kinase protein